MGSRQPSCGRTNNSNNSNNTSNKGLVLSNFSVFLWIIVLKAFLDISLYSSPLAAGDAAASASAAATTHLLTIPQALQPQLPLTARSSSSSSCSNNTSLVARLLQTVPSISSSMNETDGVIFFYHMQKCGGITIRKFANRQGKAKIKLKRFRPTPDGFLEASDKILKYLQVGNNTYPNNNPRRRPILFVEHHGGNESIVEMEPHFQQWRKASRATGVPLFVFTLLREPVAHAISHFNFFHAPPGTPPFDHTLYEPTEDNLRKIAVPERQLRMLAHGGEGVSNLAVARDVDVEVDDDDDDDDALLEDKTLAILHDHFDWIGATEQISQVTLPLLSWLLWGTTKKATKMKAKNVAAKRTWQNGVPIPQLSQRNMTVETLEMLARINQRTERVWEQEAWFSE